MSDSEHTPGRPLGVTLAIVASILVYSILPLLWVGTAALIEQRLNRVSEISIPLGEDEVTPIASGGNVDLGAGSTELILQTMLSVSFLIIAGLAWRGRSQTMRYVFLIAVVALSLLMIAMRLTSLLKSDSMGITGGSLDALFNILSNSHVLLMILVPLYVVWYLNRGPARAFYRGYYITEEDTSQ